MIHTMLCTEEYCTRQQLDRDEIVAVLADDRNLLWLDLEAPTPQEIESLAAEFDFHPLATEDATKEHQRPKIDRYDNSYFIVFYDLDYDPATGRIDAHELDAFVGKNFLITVHQEPIAEIAEVGVRLAQNLSLIERGVGVLLYSLLDTIVDHYFPVVDGIAERIQGLERRVYTVQSQRDRVGLYEDLFLLRRELLNMRRIINPERDVLLTLVRRDLPVIGKKTAIYFQDVHDHLLRVTDQLDIDRELLASVLDSYHATNSNSLNQTMRILTATSIILMSVTFIAGIYGMNFNPDASRFNMPELNAAYGYPVALLAMAAVAAVLAWVFRRRGWL